MKYLIIVAHPDDELLGCGATIHRLVREGNEVSVYSLCCRGFNREEDVMKKALDIKKEMGLKGYFYNSYDGMHLEDEKTLDIIQTIEEIIFITQPDVVITHYDKDLHDDHRIVSNACKVACRLPQRETKEVGEIKRLLYFETPSSTDWAGGFNPNVFYKVKEEDVDMKIKMLSKYDGVLRSNKHPRSAKNIKALASIRGSQCGSEYAEAFIEEFCIE